ncbi:hypothetical protein GCM10011402_28350 [Paracoccus acridae]|uniref:Uncharacterized protein n=1 Tax=Paracoccus acridae TaxID=1795310 RepID=A0ABQ1VJW4_9RHOB|nr:MULTISPECIES: hypothetical protein [Paracoccus]GGF74052.1 hypothetical protein GCM10011402_28350 [Paracoccus acridae]
MFMANNLLHRINRVLKIVGRRRGKTGWHLNVGQWQVAVDQRDAERMKIKQHGPEQSVNISHSSDMPLIVKDYGSRQGKKVGTGC